MKVYNEPLLRRAVSMMNQRPRTLDEMAEALNRDKRTIKRWLVELRARGLRVVRDGIDTSSAYYVAETRTRSWP